MTRSRLKVVSVLVVSLIGAAVLWANLRPSAGIPLQGGGELRVLGVSLGTNHVFPVESVWKHCLRAILPGPWQRPLGPSQALRFVTPNESLVV